MANFLSLFSLRLREPHSEALVALMWRCGRPTVLTTGRALSDQHR